MTTLKAIKAYQYSKRQAIYVARTGRGCGTTGVSEVTRSVKGTMRCMVHGT